MFVYILEDKLILEAKTPHERFNREHPMPVKMINATFYCWEYINGKDIQYRHTCWDSYC